MPSFMDETIKPRNGKRLSVSGSLVSRKVETRIYSTKHIFLTELKTSL